MITEYHTVGSVCCNHRVRFLLKSEFCDFSISNEDLPERRRDPLLSSMEYSESLDGHPRSQFMPSLRRAQCKLFPELTLVICSAAKVQFAIGQAVLERPINFVLENSNRSPK